MYRYKACTLNMITLVNRKLQATKLKRLVALYSFDFFCWLIYILVDYEVRLPKNHDASPIKGTICLVLKFCLLPLQISSLEIQYTALLEHLQRPKKSSSLSVSSTIYLLRWFCSFGSLFQLRCSDGVERPAPSLFFLLKAVCAVPTI